VWRLHYFNQSKGKTMSMRKPQIVIIAAIILVLFGTAVETASARAQNDSRPTDRTLINAAERITHDRFVVQTRTPLGVRVFAVEQLQPELLQAIDRGFTELFVVARRNGFRSRLSHTDYTVFVGNPDRTKDGSGAYSPDIAVGAAQYAGSVYDKGGYIFAAGMVLAYNPCAFIIALHKRDFDRVAMAVRYEGEHIVLYHNDHDRYLRTMDHSKGGGHPILQ
jgi:hypothetical protein